MLRKLSAFFSKERGESKDFRQSDHVYEKLLVKERNGAVRDGEIRYQTGHPCRVGFRLLCKQKWHEAEGRDIWEALTELRKILDKRGQTPLITGARLDAYATGMSRSMGCGDLVYLLRFGESPQPEALKYVFEPARSEDVGSVQAQEVRFRQWYDSLGDTDTEEDD